MSWCTKACRLWEIPPGGDEDIRQALLYAAAYIVEGKILR